MPIEFGRIVVVAFPCTDQSSIKRRPAIVVSNHRYHAMRRDAVIMAVTSRNRATTGEVPIEHWENAGLAKPSVVKPVFATVEQSLIVKELGVLQDADAAALMRAVALLLC